MKYFINAQTYDVEKTEADCRWRNNVKQCL